MKFYDKHLTPVSKDIQQVLLMLLVFVIGFVAGYFIGNHGKLADEKNKISNLTVSSVEMSSNVWYN